MAKKLRKSSTKPKPLVAVIEDAFGIDREEVFDPGEFVGKVHQFASVWHPDQLLGELMLSILPVLGKREAWMNLNFFFEHLNRGKEYEANPRWFRDVDKVVGRDILGMLNGLTPKQTEALQLFTASAIEALEAGQDPTEEFRTLVKEFDVWLRTRSRNEGPRPRIHKRVERWS